MNNPKELKEFEDLINRILFKYEDTQTTLDSYSFNWRNRKDERFLVFSRYRDTVKNNFIKLKVQLQTLKKVEKIIKGGIEELTEEEMGKNMYDNAKRIIKMIEKQKGIQKITRNEREEDFIVSITKEAKGKE